MRVVVAPDSFKGVLTAREAGEAIALGVRRARPEAQVEVVPMADGGEGTLNVIVDAEKGNRRRVAAHGPLGDAIDAPVGLIRHATTAVIELAGIAGFAMVPPERRDPLKTSTYGVGEVIRAAIEGEIEEIILCLGGSATVDGGAGMMQALGMTIHDRAGRLMTDPIAGGDLASIGRISWDQPPANMENVQITIACDVLNPACGLNGAAAVFGPQKGADADGVRLLEKSLSHWADLLEGISGRAIRNEPGTGAAGGIALPLLALTGATIVPGVDLVSEATGLAAKITGADLVITGEGCLDRQSMMGKVVGAVGRMCRAAEVPCVAVVGKIGEGAEDCRSVLDRWYTLDGPIEQTNERLAEVSERVVRENP
jgi:glycerate kinase